MKVIRTFVAVLVEDDIRRKIADVQARVKKLASDVSWVAPDKFHVTLKFLGDITEEQLSDVCACVDGAVRSFPPFHMSFGGLGAFPKLQKARVLWAGVEDGARELIALAKVVDDRLAQLGFEKEHKFSAHITLGRAKSNRFPDMLAKGIEEIDASGLGSQRVSSVVVMQSELKREGSVYTPLCVVKLMDNE